MSADKIMLHELSGFRVPMADIEKILADAERAMCVPRGLLETSPTISTAREIYAAELARLNREWEEYKKGGPRLQTTRLTVVLFWDHLAPRKG